MRSRRCFIIYTAICTSCRKKHAERLAALGMQISDKDTREQTAAAAGKEFQRFVEHTFVLFLSHAFRLISIICAQNEWSAVSQAVNARGRGGPE